MTTPFPTYPHGFPPEVMEEFERRIGTKTLGNFPASGTEIIKQLGEEHMRTGYPIVYTSADSVSNSCSRRRHTSGRLVSDVRDRSRTSYWRPCRCKGHS